MGVGSEGVGEDTLLLVLVLVLGLGLLLPPPCALWLLLWVLRLDEE